VKVIGESPGAYSEGCSKGYRREGQGKGRNIKRIAVKNGKPVFREGNMDNTILQFSNGKKVVGFEGGEYGEKMGAHYLSSRSVSLLL